MHTFCNLENSKPKLSFNLYYFLIAKMITLGTINVADKKTSQLTIIKPENRTEDF